jgi:hypothetical protein
MYIIASSSSSSSSVDSTCRRYAPTARLIQSSLRHVLHVGHAASLSHGKAARRRARPASFEFIGKRSVLAYAHVIRGGVEGQVSRSPT